MNDAVADDSSFVDVVVVVVVAVVVVVDEIVLDNPSSMVDLKNES